MKNRNQYVVLLIAIFVLVVVMCILVKVKGKTFGLFGDDSSSSEYSYSTLYTSEASVVSESSESMTSESETSEADSSGRTTSRNTTASTTTTASSSAPTPTPTPKPATPTPTTAVTTTTTTATTIATTEATTQTEAGIVDYRLSGSVLNASGERETVQFSGSRDSVVSQFNSYCSDNGYQAIDYSIYAIYSDGTQKLV